MKPQTPADTPYTAPKADLRINIGFVPAFPEVLPKDEVEATNVFNLAGDAYAKCIRELSSAAEQDAAIRGEK